ncbi:34619_t:CDS:2, partial [Gigaspora margarita]
EVKNFDYGNKIFLTNLHEVIKNLDDDETLISSKGFEEAQLAAEMLTYGSKNMYQIVHQASVISNQTIFGICTISSYFTFYEPVISAEYWNELGMPEEEVPEAGLDIAKPN